MRARPLTLTGIGLSARAELRLKSLLEIVNSKTTDRWSFIEHGDAHVALCDPTSPLCTVVMKRSAGGATRFISLVEDVSLAAAGTSVIRDPIRAAELIELLNLVSSTLSCEAPQSEWAALASPTTALDGRDAFPLAVAVRGLARLQKQSVYALQAGSVEMHVLPASRTVHLSRALSHDDLLQLAAPRVPISIQELPPSDVPRLAESGAVPCRLDAFLWRLGLHGDKSRLLPELPPDACFRLRRWPDFGHVEHTSDHLRLAARLVRQKATVLELALAASLPVSSINSFINACRLCELIEVHPADQSMPARATLASTQATRYGNIFRTIRSVLRFGASQ